MTSQNDHDAEGPEFEPSDSQDDLRAAAVKSLKKKSDFFTYLWVWLGVTLILNAVWLLSGGLGTYYWPGWPMFGMGIGAFFIGLDAFGPGRKVYSSEKIEAEMRRLGGR